MKLSIEKRDAKSKGELHAIRRRGDIPAVVYSPGQPNQYIVIKGNEFVSAYRDIPQGGLATMIFEMEIDGKSCKAIVKDIHYHPTTYTIKHLDFMILQENRSFKVSVPVRCTGMEECVGIKLGGFLRMVKRHIPVRCLPTDMPKEFLLDIRNLKIRGSKRVQDIQLPKGVTPLVKPEDVLAIIAKR